MGVREARRLIKDYGVRGFKFHPTVQAFFPNDHEAYPLYEVIAEAKLPAIFHTGQTGIGAGMPGGGVGAPEVVFEELRDTPRVACDEASASMPQPRSFSAAALAVRPPTTTRLQSGKMTSPWGPIWKTPESSGSW